MTQEKRQQRSMGPWEANQVGYSGQLSSFATFLPSTVFGYGRIHVLGMDRSCHDNCPLLLGSLVRISLVSVPSRSVLVQSLHVSWEDRGFLGPWKAGADTV